MAWGIGNDGTGLEEMLSRFFRDPALATSFFAPLPTPVRESFDAPDTVSPQALDGRTESIAALAVNNRNGLEHSFPRVSSKYGGMADPF